MIFVTGGSGLVGSAVLGRLSQHGSGVRALAHSASGRSAIEAAGAEAVPGDLDSPKSLTGAMDGCSRLFLLSPPHPQQVAREEAAIAAAKEAGIAHVVALSIIAADTRSPVPFSRWHAEIDQYLIDSGMAYTLLRPAGFMQIHLWPVHTITTQNRWYGMTGDGAAGFIDAHDVAAVAAEILTAGGHEGATYELTGPAAISMPQAAATVTEVTGRPVEYIDLSPEAYESELAKAGTPDLVVHAISTLYQAIRAGHAATVTNSVEQVTGRQAGTYRQFVEAHQDRL